MPKIKRRKNNGKTSTEGRRIRMEKQNGTSMNTETSVVNMVQDMRRSRKLIKQTEEQLCQVLAQTDFNLVSMEGINVVIAAELVSEIGIQA